jgi:hypothetical protein
MGTDRALSFETFSYLIGVNFRSLHRWYLKCLEIGMSVQTIAQSLAPLISYCLYTAPRSVSNGLFMVNFTTDFNKEH